MSTDPHLTRAEVILFHLRELGPLLGTLTPERITETLHYALSAWDARTMIDNGSTLQWGVRHTRSTGDTEIDIYNNADRAVYALRLGHPRASIGHHLVARVQDPWVPMPIPDHLKEDGDLT